MAERVPPSRPAPSHTLELGPPNGCARARWVREVDPIPRHAMTCVEAALECAEERYERRELGHSLEQGAGTDVDLYHDPIRAANLSHNLLDPA